MTANSTENSKTIGRPFQKGKSGNPSGRPKKPAILKKMAKASLPELWAIAQDDKTNVKVKADIYKWIYEQHYGKATQRIEGEDGGAPIISVAMIPPDVKDYVG